MPRPLLFSTSPPFPPISPATPEPPRKKKATMSSCTTRAPPTAESAADRRAQAREADKENEAPLVAVAVCKGGGMPRKHDGGAGAGAEALVPGARGGVRFGERRGDDGRGQGLGEAAEGKVEEGREGREGREDERGEEGGVEGRGEKGEELDVLFTPVKRPVPARRPVSSPLPRSPLMDITKVCGGLPATLVGKQSLFRCFWLYVSFWSGFSNRGCLFLLLFFVYPVCGRPLRTPSG